MIKRTEQTPDTQTHVCQTDGERQLCDKRYKENLGKKTNLTPISLQIFKNPEELKNFKREALEENVRGYFL